MTQTSTKQAETKIESTWNKVIFTGNVGKDPDMSFTPGGKSVTKFSLAVGQGKDGQGKEKPSMWLNVETWNKLAEDCNGSLTKGARIEVSGRLVQDVWEKNGEKQYRLKVVAQNVRLLKRSNGKATTGFIDESGEATSGDYDTLGDLDDHPF